MKTTIECPIFRMSFLMSTGELFYKRDQKTKRVLLSKLHVEKAVLKKNMKSQAPIFVGEAEKTEIVAMYLAGEDITSISSYYCISESTIRNWSDKVTIPPGVIRSPYLRKRLHGIKMWKGLEKLDLRSYSLRWAINAYVSQQAYRYKIKSGESVKHLLSDIHHLTISRD